MDDRAAKLTDLVVSVVAEHVLYREGSILTDTKVLG
jgi:hypothetical protein